MPHADASGRQRNATDLTVMLLTGITMASIDHEDRALQENRKPPMQVVSALLPSTLLSQ